MRRTIDAIVLALLCDSERKATLVFGLGKRDGGPEGSGETAPSSIQDLVRLFPGRAPNTTSIGAELEVRYDMCMQMMVCMDSELVQCTV